MLATAAHRQPRHVVRLVSRPVPAGTPLDAAGCPVTARCTVRPSLPAATRAAIARSLPGSRLSWQSVTADAATGMPYRYSALVSIAAGAELMFTAQCVPGSSALVSEHQRTSAQQRSDLAGNQIVLVLVRELVVPGAAGCSAALRLDTEGGSARYLPAVRQLAHSPDVQVRS